MGSTRWLRSLITLVVGLVIAILPAFPTARPVAAGGCAQLHDTTALAQEPGGALLAGTKAGGVYRLHDDCWTALTAPPGAMQIGTLLAVPGPHAALLAGGSWVVSARRPGVWLFRSEDGGAHWSAATTGLPQNQILPVQLLALHDGTLVLSYDCPSDVLFRSKILHCPQSLARSEDGGSSWQVVGPHMREALGLVALADGSLLTVSWAPAPAHAVFYRSTDQGRTWKQTNTSAQDPSGVSEYYAVPWEAHGVIGVGDFESGHALLIHSADGGAHWSANSHPIQYWQDAALTAVLGLPHTRTLLLGGFDGNPLTGGVYRGDAAGGAYTHAKMTPGVDAIWALLGGADGVTAYAAADSGVFQSSDDGRTWQHLGS